MPQWSPVMKTGNTAHRPGVGADGELASMEPGHEDREYLDFRDPAEAGERASMEPGHEDREYRRLTTSTRTFRRSLNGARS